MSSLVRFLLAYTLGAVVGAGTLGIEWLLLGHRRSIEGLLGYCLLGGLIGGVSRLLLGLVLPARAARAGALLTLAAFGSLVALYVINVHVLAGEHYLTPRSLALDGLVLSLALVLAYGLSRSSRVRAAQLKRLAGGAVLGASVLTANVAGLWILWPAQPAAAPGEGDRPNLLLVVLDSARRDHMGLHGYPRPTSPRLDAVAGRGRVYDNAYAASSWTVPSVMAMLWSPPAAGRGTLAQELTARGYRTACFTDNPHMSEGVELMQGFGQVSRSVSELRWPFRRTIVGEVIERLDPGSDRRLVDHALDWTKAAPGPLFLLVQLMDSHTPYRHPPIDGQRRRGRRIEFPRGDLAPTDEEAQDIVARYDGGIRSADAQAGRLIDAVASLGRPYLAIVTSDHGESLGEAGRWFHGGSLAPELLEIPLVVVGAGVEAGDVAGPVGHASIPTTFAAAAGIPCGDCAGGDLRNGEGSEVVEGGLPPRLAYRIATGHKVVVDRVSGVAQLFDLRHDPAEARDLAGERPELLSILGSGLGRGAPVPEPVLDPSALERIRALGYVDGSR